MRTTVPKTLRRARLRTGRMASTDAYGLTGVFEVRTPRGLSPGGIPTALRIIATDPATYDGQPDAAFADADQWEHVSVVVVGHRRTPTWEEMAWVKRLFWRSDEAVVELHPPDADYVNNAEALHLWRPVSGEVPRPPVALIGIPTPCSLADFVPADDEVDQQSERFAVARDWSQAGAKPSVCYTVYEAGPRGARLRDVVRTPRRSGVTEHAEDAAVAQQIADALNAQPAAPVHTLSTGRRAA